MKFQKLNIAFLFAVLVFSASSMASSKRDQRAFTELNAAVAQVLKSQDFTEMDQNDFQLKAFLLRIQASFGLEVPIFASAKIVPEVELIFEK